METPQRQRIDVPPPQPLSQTPSVRGADVVRGNDSLVLPTHSNGKLEGLEAKPLVISYLVNGQSRAETARRVRAYGWLDGPVRTALQTVQEPAIVKAIAELVLESMKGAHHVKLALRDLRKTHSIEGEPSGLEGERQLIPVLNVAVKSVLESLCGVSVPKFQDEDED